MQTFQYVDTSGQLKTFQANSADEALKGAPGIAKNSGVMPLQNTSSTQTQPTTQSTNNLNVPVSSASYNLQNNLQTTMQNTFNPPAAPALNSMQQRVKDFLGTDDESYIRGLDTASLLSFDKEAAARAKGEEAIKKSEDFQRQSYNSALAAQNAQYAQLSSDLARRREGALDTAKTTAAQLNPYSGANTDENNYMTAVNTQYDRLQSDIDLKAQQARAALEEGNMKAYEAIQMEMANLYTSGAKNIQSLLSNMESKKLQQEQFNLSLAKEDRMMDQAGFTNFTNLIKTYGGSDALRTEAEDFLRTGQAGLTLQPFLTRAYDSGMTTKQAASMILAGTDAYRKEEALQSYRAGQQDIAWQRLALSIANAGKDKVERVEINNPTIQGAVNRLGVNLGLSTENKNIMSKDIVDAANTGGLPAVQDRMLSYITSKSDVATRKDIKGALALRDQLNEIKDLQTQLEASGKYTGPKNATVEYFLNFVGNTKDPELAQFKAKAQQINNELILKNLGTTFTDKAYKTFTSQNAQLKNGAKLNLVKINEIASMMDRDLETNIAGVIGYDAYNDIYGSQTPQKTSIPTEQSGAFRSKYGY